MGGREASLMGRFKYLPPRGVEFNKNVRVFCQFFVEVGVSQHDDSFVEFSSKYACKREHKKQYLV